LDASDTEIVHEESQENPELNDEDATTVLKHLNVGNYADSDNDINDLDSDLLGIEMETVWISPLVKLALNQHVSMYIWS